MNRACSRCGRIHSDKTNCKTWRTTQDTDDRKLRRSTAWKKKSEAVRGEVLFCEVCKAEGIYTYNDLEVHHITKLKDAPAGLLEDDNLIVLCPAHHRLADHGQIDPRYLRELISTRAVAPGAEISPPVF